jgi:iron complex transport system ATP-binding protein
MNLTAHGVSYRVGGAEILASTELAFVAGELVAVVGPNGAGKTTLLHVLAGDLHPATGSVTHDGDALQEMPALELALRRAVLAQGGPQDIPFPVAAVVALGRSPHRRAEANSARADRAATEAAMDAVGVGHLADRVFATLSAGERALASLARVLAQVSPVLLLDEPTAALDIAVEERVMAMLRERAAERIVITVLHDLNLAARYADRAILLADGAVAADGLPEEVFTPARLSEVYRHPIEVVPHPLRKGLLILVV